MRMCSNTLPEFKLGNSLKLNDAAHVRRREGLMITQDSRSRYRKSNAISFSVNTKLDAKGIIPPVGPNLEALVLMTR